jgi:hypothetical protein
MIQTFDGTMTVASTPPRPGDTAENAVPDNAVISPTPQNAAAQSSTVTGKASKAVDNVSSRKVHNCPYNGCDYSSTHFSSLRQHLAYIHDEGVRWFSCDLCDYKAKKSGTVRRHKADVHNIDVVWYPCTFAGCSYRAKQKSHMKRHVQVVHVQKKVNEWKFCPYCVFRTKSQKWLVRHTEQHRREHAEHAAQQNSAEKGVVVAGGTTTPTGQMPVRALKVDKTAAPSDVNVVSSRDVPGVIGGLVIGALPSYRNGLESKIPSPNVATATMDTELLERQRIHASMVAQSLRPSGEPSSMAPAYPFYQAGGAWVHGGVPQGYPAPPAFGGGSGGSIGRPVNVPMTRMDGGVQYQPPPGGSYVMAPPLTQPQPPVGYPMMMGGSPAAGGQLPVNGQPVGGQQPVGGGFPSEFAERP